MNETVSLIICILSFVLALVSVITVIVSLKQNAKQIKFNKEQLEEMRKEHQLSMQPVLMLENPVFKIERPRPFYSPPEKEFSIQSRYYFYTDIRNVTKAVATFVNAEAKLLVVKPEKKLQKRSAAIRANILTGEGVTNLHFMFVDDEGELVYNALREANSRLMPRVEVTLYYKNTSGGCFKTSSIYTVVLDENNESTIKEWHTFLDSAGTRYKEELDQMKREGDLQGTHYDSIKDKMNRVLGDVRTIDVKCFEGIEEYMYSSISQEEYERAIESFNYPVRIIKNPICDNNEHYR